jgi:hypothetical protein
MIKLVKDNKIAANLFLSTLFHLFSDFIKTHLGLIGKFKGGY